MPVILAIVAGILFAAGIYSILRRSVVKLVIGLVLISQAVNMALFTAGGLLKGKPAFVSAQQIVADPLPQALILTAIVISFGVLAFTLVLVYRTVQSLQTDDIDQLRETD